MKMKVIQKDLERDQILLGDLNNLAKLKEIVNPSQDDVRLYASTVRRLLLDGVLPSAAGSRRMPLTFLVPDVKPIASAARNSHVVCFILGGLKAFGVQISRGVVSVGAQAPAMDFDASKLIPLKLDSFLKQVVGFINGTEITRREVISYVANKAGGVHYDMTPSNSLPEKKLKAMGQLRRSLRLGIQNGGAIFNCDISGLEDQSEQFRYEPEFLDAVFMEFLASIQFIVESPDVNNLKAAIIHDLTK
ncbi:hypothetical protein [Massilia sp. SYSU DXS3249]